MTSSDPWFHAISLAHAPDGSIYIVDFYREIIEDYSAIPRYLQQQYGLVAGKNHGRIWRLTHDQLPTENADSNMSLLFPENLVAEVASARFWRRETARRLLIEKTWDAPTKKAIIKGLNAHITMQQNVESVLNAFSTLVGLQSITPQVTLTGLGHRNSLVRRRSLRYAEKWLKSQEFNQNVFRRVIELKSDPSSIVRLQLALSLGECKQKEVLDALAYLARKHGHESWMQEAILSAVPNRAGQLLVQLILQPNQIGEAKRLCGPMCTAIARRGDSTELSQVLEKVGGTESALIRICLDGLRKGVTGQSKIKLTPAARMAVKKLAQQEGQSVRKLSRQLVSILKVETPGERMARLQAAEQILMDVQRSTRERVGAAIELTESMDQKTITALLKVLPNSTPQLKDVILKSLIQDKRHQGYLLDALESNKISLNFLDAIDRATLLQSAEGDLRQRAAKLLKVPPLDSSKLGALFKAALKNQRNVVNGHKAFEKHCSNCHRAHGIGHDVGPNLSAEFLRAEETIIQDVLLPNAKLSAGFATYLFETKNGQALSGILIEESPTSITLRQPESKDQVILRKDIERFRSMNISMMPDDLGKELSPQAMADILAWLRRPPSRLVLVDENRELVAALNEGAGSAEFVSNEKHHGKISLKVSPPQRYSRQVPQWNFRIRKNPGPGEYRYLRFSWKTNEAHGVMIELADQGNWPPAKKAVRRYHAGRNTTGWGSVAVSKSVPKEWTVVTRDLWKDFGDFTLTGIAPTTMGGVSYFDQIELLKSANAE